MNILYKYIHESQHSRKIPVFAPSDNLITISCGEVAEIWLHNSHYLCSLFNLFIYLFILALLVLELSLFPAGVWAGPRYCSSISWSLLRRLYLQMMSPVQDGGAHIRDILASLLYSERKWIFVVHLYIQSMVVTCKCKCNAFIIIFTLLENWIFIWILAPKEPGDM